MRFEGRVFKEGKWLAIEVPVLGVYTQARTKRSAYAMIKDAIEEMADVDGFEVQIFPGRGEYFEVGSVDQGTLFAFLLRRQRQVRGLSLADVAKRLGLKSRNAYARYEQGKAIPTVEKLAQLLKAVNPDHEFVLKLESASNP